MLVIPLINHENGVIGVIQLINKTLNHSEISILIKQMNVLLKALSAQAAMALTNSQLILSLEGFLDALYLQLQVRLMLNQTYIKNI